MPTDNYKSIDENKNNRLLQDQAVREELSGHVTHHVTPALQLCMAKAFIVVSFAECVRFRCGLSLGARIRKRDTRRLARLRVVGSPARLRFASTQKRSFLRPSLRLQNQWLHLESPPSRSRPRQARRPLALRDLKNTWGNCS